MEVTPITKDDQLADARRDGKHPRGCKCRPCIGRRNRRSGREKQTAARKALGVVDRFQSRLGDEENWRLPWARVEVKSGAQVGPIATRFLKAEAQSEAARPVGDLRPFVMIAMPPGMTDGLLIVRLRDVDRLRG